MTENRRRAEVMRLLDRYLIEVVERYDLCPWARSSRERGEVGVEVLWGTPTAMEWVATARALLAQPHVKVVMVVAPELAITTDAFRAVRATVASNLTSAGVADFHPDAALDLATPARLVPFVRRSPDPLLQLVPLELLASVRTLPMSMERAQQAQLLGGGSLAAPKPDIAERIALANHTTVTAAREQILETLEAIGADRDRSYALAGIAPRRVTGKTSP